MPPRYAYWTILVDEQPTAFRAGDREDLQPTFNRLKEKHPTARMVWFQNGTMWNSRLDAQAAMRARGEMGRRGDARQGGGFRDRGSEPARVERRDSSGKLEWQPRNEGHPPSERRLDWKPKGAGRPPSNRIKGGFRRPGGERRTPMREGGPLEWRPKGSEAEGRGGQTGERKGGKPAPPREKRGIDAKRDKNWRPGGEHKDPRQKYKDAKKAKWTRFKQTVRKRWESKQGGKKKNGE